MLVIFQIGNPIYKLLIFFLINEAGILYKGNGKTRGPFIYLFQISYIVLPNDFLVCIIKLE